MDRAAFEQHATEFAQEIATLLDATLVGEITANAFEINEEKLRAVIKTSLPATSSFIPTQSPLASYLLEQEGMMPRLNSKIFIIRWEMSVFASALKM